MLLLVLFLLLSSSFSAVSSDALSDAKHIMLRLRLAISNNNIKHVAAFVAKDFVFDNCGEETNFGDFMESLEVIATPPLSMSLDFDAISASIAHGTLTFVMHFADQTVETYDAEYSAQKLDNVNWTIVSGRTLGCLPEVKRAFAKEEEKNEHIGSITNNEEDYFIEKQFPPYYEYQ